MGPEAVRFRSGLTARGEDLALRETCGPPLFVFTGLPKVGPGDGEFKYLGHLG